MGKAARNQARRVVGGPNTGAPAGHVFPQFPYEKRFTRQEIHGDILPRSKRLGDAMRDGKGPNGAILYIPGDVFELWMIHAALAGCDVDESKAYIRSRRLPDQAGRLVDAVEWVLKADDTPEKLAQDAEREAAAYVAAIDTNLRPEVRDAIRRRLRGAAEDVADYMADDPDADRLRDKPRDFGAPRLVEFRDEPPPPPQETP